MRARVLTNLQHAIESAGFVANIRELDGIGATLDCFHHIDENRTHGPAFRVVVHESQPYLVSCGYAAWSVPRDANLAAVVIDWLNVQGKWVMLPAELEEKHSLVSIRYDEFLALFGLEMKIPTPPSRRRKD